MGTLYFGGNSIVDGQSGTYTLPVPPGYRWVLVYIYSRISSSATAGTRSIDITRNPGGNFSGTLFSNSYTVLQNQFSNASNAQDVQLAPFSGASSPAVESYPDYELTSADVLNVVLTLLTGDTAKMLIIIREVLDL